MPPHDKAMPIPDFQTMLLPLLQIFQDGAPKSVSEVYEHLAAHFNLSEEERAELLPSGSQARFVNRVSWARAHLGKAGLLAKIKDGVYQLTPEGQRVLVSPPSKIDLRFLDQFEGHLEFRKRKPVIEERGGVEAEQATQTPEEVLDKAYQELRRSLAQELLEKIRQASPRFFEQLVVDLLLKMGYGGSRLDAGSAIGKAGDEGVDGIIKEDKLGLDVIYLQAKRWSNTVGRPDIQAFAGALEGHRARKGVFITTSQFSSEAKDYVSRIERRIVLIDGQQLSELMIDHDLGVTSKNTYVVRKIDSDYFSEE
jgi:restriction system protein